MDDSFMGVSQARVYLLSAGFSLTFGSMFAKTYRVHRLFTYFGAGLVKDKLLKDKQLITLILIPLIIDAIILTLWIMIDPMERQLYNLSLEISYSHRGVVYQPQIEVCSCHNTVGWYIALFGYKSIILVIGVFMAWKTRHIKVPALNDSQYIGICVYSAVFSTIIVILSSFISNYLVFTYLAKAGSILTSTTITLFLLFQPKLKSLSRKVDGGDPIMHSMGLKIESNTRRFIIEDRKEQISRLEIQNKVYRSELAALDKEISRLEDLLMCPTTTYPRKSGVNVIEATVDHFYLRVPQPVKRWASWSTTQCNLNRERQGFLSENKVNGDQSAEKNNFIDRLNLVFGSFTHLDSICQQHQLSQGRNPFTFQSGRVSYCEVHPRLSKSLTKAKSETDIINVLTDNENTLNQ